MANLTTQVLAESGTVPTYVTAGTGGTGDNIIFSDAVILHVKNGSGGSITVTVAAAVACSQGFLHDQTVTVAPGADKFIANFESRFVDPVTNFIHVTYSSTTTITVAAIGA